MHVVEVWDMYTDEATELYKEELNLTYMNILNFNVHDEYAQYDLLQKWNVGAGFHEKKNKYGINIVKNGIELCKPIEVKLWKEYLMFAQIFGIAQGLQSVLRICILRLLLILIVIHGLVIVVKVHHIL